MDYFESQDIPDSFWLTKWFLTLFLYSFPVQICSRFWDYIITNDIFSIVKLIIPILDVFKTVFMKSDACMLMELFTSLAQNEYNLTNPQSPFYINITDIVKKADSIKISKKVIANYAREYLTTHDQHNEYASLYSHYDNQVEFLHHHTHLLSIKVLPINISPSIPQDT